MKTLIISCSNKQRHKKKLSPGFSIRSDTHPAVQPRLEMLKLQKAETRLHHCEKKKDPQLILNFVVAHAKVRSSLDVLK